MKARSTPFLEISCSEEADKVLELGTLLSHPTITAVSLHASIFLITYFS